ncbi:MAG TPA: energy transducer TonB [Candidatus Dormibacteraeota bacterium]|nr:energy transducer TonB [Candidatus Dormibacteraeota bacterium]
MKLSSAGDKTSSTVLPSQGSSNSAPEEFSLPEPPGDANERGSSAPLPEATPIELTESNLAKQSPAEPEEDTATPLKTKPLPKVNAVSREVPVKVTGARAGGASEERDLFAESTTTVLVFEKGAVIRLTAAVTPGQLLFLTNEESKREVVTQVIRKRTFRPTECYVELEFTEPVPGFWGMEFSAASALLPKDAMEIATAEMIASAETTEDELDGAAPPPTAEEVEALKREVEALRSQLRLLQTPAEQEPPRLLTVPKTSLPLPDAAPKAEAPVIRYEYAPAVDLTSQSAPVETAPKPSSKAASGQVPRPKRATSFHVPVPKQGRSSLRPRGQFTPGFRTGVLRLAILSSILAALIVTAWYKGWFPGIHQPKKISVSSWTGGVTTLVSTLPVSPGASAAKTNLGSNAAVSTKGTAPTAGLSSEPSVESATGNEKSASSPPAAVIVEKPANATKTPRASMIKSSPSHSLPAKAVSSPAASAVDPTFVPPKLVRSERAIVSLEDLRDFETGSVVVDAIIDTDGNVTSTRVLSGPPSLRWPAFQALKNYKYEPAMQNGKPVPAHVTVKIQFHFE